MKRKLAWFLILFMLLFFFVVIVINIYNDTIRTPDENISRGFIKNTLASENIEQNIANKSHLIKINEEMFAIGYLEKENLSFDFFDSNLKLINTLKIEFKNIKDFGIRVKNKEQIELFTLSDNMIRKTLLDITNFKRIGKDLNIDSASKMKINDGYLLYFYENELSVLTQENKLYKLKDMNKIIDATFDIYTNEINIVYATIHEMNTKLKYSKLISGEFKDTRELKILGTDTNRKLRSINLFVDDFKKVLLYGIKDNKSQKVFYNKIDVKKVNSIIEPISIINQDSKPVFYDISNQMILLVEDYRGNHRFIQAVVKDINTNTILKTITKGQISAYNIERIILNDEEYYKYENVMAFKKEVYIASSKPSILKQSSKASMSEINNIISKSLLASIMGYAFSLSYFGYIFIFISLLFFVSMLFFVSWTERNPMKIILIAAGFHLFSQITTMSTYLFQNSPENIVLPFYLKSPAIVIAMILCAMVTSLIFIFFRYNREEMKQNFWGIYFEFFLINSILYMMIFFPYLALYYM